MRFWHPAGFQPQFNGLGSQNRAYKALQQENQALN